MQHSPFLFNVAVRYSGNRHDAEDNLQEAWINIFKNLHQYKEDGKLHAWMKRIVINVALGLKRKKWSSVVLVEHDVGLDQEVQPTVIKEMEVKDMMEYIFQLPPGYQEIFKLYVIDEFKHQEIADMMGIEASTSRAKLTIARRKLKTIINTTSKLYQHEES